MIVGVGSSLRDTVLPDATEAAVAAVESGEALQGNSYCDTFQELIG